MYNKSVLSYTVTIAIILLNTHFNAYAKFFSAGKGEYKIAPTGERYENIYALNGGKILGKDLKITGLPIQEGSTIKNISGVESNKSGSMIELEGNTTIQNVATGLWAQESGTIKMNGGSIYTKKVGIQAPIGVEAKSNGIIELNKVEIETSHQGQNIMIVDGIGASIKSGGVLRMTDGSIQANYLGVSFEESNNNNNTLENVKINITGPIATSKESVGISAVKNSQVTLKNVTITHAKISVYADDNSQITISEGSIHGDNKGIYAEKDSTIILKDNVEVSSNNYGLSTNGLQSKIIMTGGTITSAGLEPAVLAGSGGQIDLTDVIVQTLDNETTTHNNQIITQTLQVKDEPSTTQGLQAQYLQSKITMTRGSITTAGLTPAVLAAAGGQIDLNDVSINARNTGLQAQGEQSKIVMEKGTLITTNFNPTILAGSGGQINLLDVSIKSNHIGLQAQEKQSKITMKGGTLTKTGPLPAIFAAFGGEIELTDVHIYADDNGLAIRGNQSKITLKDSQIHASTVLIGTSYKGTSGESNIIADHSILKGGANDSEGNLTQTIFSLINGTTWYLRANNKKNNKRHTDRTDNLHSEVSMLHLNDSKIVFNEPTENQYQTLHIGTKTSNTINHNIMNKEVYTANGNATIYFNIEWSDGLAKEQQKADRLLIHGDVSGTTTVYVNNLLEGETLQTENSIPLNTRGLSLIQVSGKADENAFQLANGYLIVDGSPYKYVLRAYGPTSSHGKANVKQSFLGKNKSFWDFRLQSATLDPEEKIRALVPQTASYLVMPNTLFSAGFTDVSNQNALLETMKDKNQGAFLSSYGKKMALSSDRTPLQYGYGADINYAAMQAGITLATLEKQNITTSFGFLGTYGKLAFTPKDMQDAGKSTLDKWSITAYGKIQNANGIYVNAFLSYGALKGNITTALIKATTILDNTKTWSASATVGQKLASDIEGVVFEPQAQLVYQHLMIGTLSDVDGFKVDMGNPHQWLVRIGGRVTKTTVPAKKDNTTSFYGKLNLIKSFGENAAIQIGDTFHLDPMGTSIEGGMGINAHLTSNIALHGDVSYQYKLQKIGISGINFSGGMHYHF